HDLRDSSCTFCGQCVQTCPTGALADKKAIRDEDTPGEITKTRSICPYCGVGCSVDILTKGEKIVGVQPAMDGPANEGALCIKGQFAFDFVQHDDRLTKRSTSRPQVSVRLVRNMVDTRSMASLQGVRRMRRPTPCKSSSERGSGRTR
ncbi:MAG: 4Fe-4S binding protein, partial [Verrucomicrobiales bacterium]